MDEGIRAVKKAVTKSLLVYGDNSVIVYIQHNFPLWYVKGHNFDVGDLTDIIDTTIGQ